MSIERSVGRSVIPYPPTLPVVVVRQSEPELGRRTWQSRFNVLLRKTQTICINHTLNSGEYPSQSQTE